MQIYSRAMFVLNLQQKRQWPQAATICGTKKENDDEKNNTTGPYCIFRLHPATCTEKSCHSAGKNLPRYRISLPVIANIGKM